MANAWDKFFKEKMIKIFSEKETIIDIGGGLRVGTKTNRRERKNDWLNECLVKKNYKVLDKVTDFNPDIVGDIQALPMPDNSVDAVICIAVLEHVEEPQRAMKEIWRVLKPGGYCFLYVPFLYYYHPCQGYYQDFYRFTIDGVKYLTRDFRSVESQSVRGAVATLANLVPIFSKRPFFSWLDKVFGKSASRQTSGYYIFCVK